ncbi:hypothetical protein HPB48_000674 [Haemaphysalis longicornis]|uniref:Uncharacterized protein n=1 Tax=Haemaphysalis longicornis TaxID=44386 RepID=A0A9J6GQW7_HAELO|nr:hypothetical protein HPB48_000674 [Haemaphysalis longicornis]
MLLGFWLLSVFPVSFYFRGELTSHIAVKVSPNPIDTLSELEAGLTKSEVLPCVVKGVEPHVSFESKDFGQSPGLYSRLGLAFQKNAPTTRLIFLARNDCLRNCATRPGFVCLVNAVSPCEGFSPMYKVVPSKETLQLAFMSTPVRRHFPKASAYRRLMTRIFETSLNKAAFTARCGVDISQKGNLVLLIGRREKKNLH